MTTTSNNLLYIGYYVNDRLFQTIVDNNINNMSAASHRLEEALLKEFAKMDYLNTKAISYVPSSPLLNFSNSSSVGDLTIEHIYIRKGSILSCLKGAWMFGKYLFTKVSTGSNIVMYAVNPVFMIPLVLGKYLRNLTLTTICSEVPAFRRYNKSFQQKVKRAFQTFFNNRFDKYILLAEPMKEAINIGPKPYLVMEGVASSLPDHINKTERRNIVMYAGGLHPDNNITLLIDACERSQMVEECWICGSGPQEKEIRDRIANSSKIKMLGRLTSAEVLEKEKQVKILVNLRDKNNPLTRYSFPSKVIEYLSSGAHVISSVLDGIPGEYYEYLYQLDDYKPDSLLNVIESIMSLPTEEFYERSNRALDFLNEKKSASIQAKKIIDFVWQH